MNNPCKDCLDKVVDEYGYFCDLSCGKHSAWTNYQAGIKEVVEWLYYFKFRRVVDKKHIHKLRIEVPVDIFEDKLKEWGIE